MLNFPGNRDWRMSMAENSDEAWMKESLRLVCVNFPFVERYHLRQDLDLILKSTAI